MINKPVPEHRRCHGVQSSGHDRALQEEQGSPGPSGLSTAIDPAPAISCHALKHVAFQAVSNSVIHRKFISYCKTYFMTLFTSVAQRIISQIHFHYMNQIMIQ